MGELIPYWFRLTNVHKHIKNKELAGELSVMSILGTMRYVVRTMLHTPQIWETAVACMQRGMRVGQESDAIFLAKMETVWNLPLEDARRVLGVRGAEDVDTAREGAIWFGRAAA
jgi:ubiquinone biosynthesis protein Coq4